MNPALTAAQCAALERAADATGCYGDLLYFHAVRGDRDAFQAAAGRAREGPPGDRLAAQVLAGDTPHATLLDGAAASDDPWLAAAVVKHCLRADDVAAALKCATFALQRQPANPGPLNLVAAYCLNSGQPALAAQLIERSLAIVPPQQDWVQAREAPGPVPLVLDPFPAAPIAYYIPAYNVAAYMAAAIEGLIGQCHPLAEILVIDDGSTDDSAAIARTYPVRIVAHEANRGLAAARNSAFAASTAVYVGSVDTDAVPEPGHARQALLAFERVAGPRLAGVGGRLVEAHCEAPPDLWRAVHLSQDRGPRPYCMMPPPDFKSMPIEARLAYDDPDIGHFLPGANTVLRRDAVAAAGGYDAALRTNAEDIDICRKLKAHGYGYAYTPWAVAKHMRTDTVASVLRTAWNYTFPQRHQAGNYTSLEAATAFLRDHIMMAHAKLDNDLRAGRPQLAYLDILYLFASALLDLGYQVRQGNAAEAEARYIEEALIATLAPLDARFGGKLAAKAAADLAPFRQPPGTAEAPPGAVQAQLSTATEAIGQFFALYSRELYGLIVQA